MRNIILLLCVFSTVHLSIDGAPPIKKCNASDRNCLKISAENYLLPFIGGIPEFGVESFSPLRVNSIDASTSNLQLFLKDVKISNLESCKPMDLSRNSTKTIRGQLICDPDFEADIDMKGRLLLIPIEGKGHVKAKLRRAVLTTDAILNTKEGKNGKSYWDIKSYTYKYDIQGKTEVTHLDLFKGNPLLMRVTRNLLLNNSHEVALEVAPPIMKALSSRLANNINNMFHRVPIQDLSID